MKSIFLAATLFAGVLGVGRAAAPTSPEPARITSSTTEAMVSTPSELTLDQSQGAMCPFQWFCDDTATWFATRSQCLSSCSSECQPDYNCSLNCVCP